MKVLCVFVTFLAAAFALTNDGVCYKGIEAFCRNDKKDTEELKKCNAKYGAIDSILPNLQEYVNSHILRNFEYMLLSTYYGNYQKSREGFEKLFMELSDSKWETAIDLIKQITKRGGEIHFTKGKPIPDDDNEVYELYEINSLAKALDTEKAMADAAYHIHSEASRRGKEYHDPEILSYMENEFLHKQSGTIRKLSGHVSDLTKLLDSSDRSLALYIFDDYLKKLSIV